MPASPRRRVDVVVITWNDDPATLAAAIASAQASRGVDVGVIVVDNGSSPPAAVPDGVALLRNGANLGVSRARNQGVRAGSAPLVCLLDSDARLLPDSLCMLAQQIDGGVVLAAPVFNGQAPEASGGRAPGVMRKLLRVAGVTGSYARMRPDGATSWPVDFVIGACQLFRRDAFDAVGGLDETYFYGPEDVDFCMRLRASGGVVVQTSTASCHHPPRRRNRRLLTRSGLRHGMAVLRYLWRRRGIATGVR
ncbi:MAG TPA: glycosyltransferase [Candidatus Angelobacter sp.]|jgi:GT2 family glycosyltransferase|nr:glycosyltransferase [Candidatus Angelobacter sp.]